MVESFSSSEDLGMIALTLRTGGEIWLAAASIYAVEKDPKEDFTAVKTMGEMLGVVETPRVIFDTIEAIQRNAAHRAERRAVEEFVDFITENEIDVEGVRDSAITLLESDARMKEIRKRGLAKNELMTKAEEDRIRAEQEAAYKRERLQELVKDLGLSPADTAEILGLQVASPRFDGGDVDPDSLTDDQLRQKLRNDGLDDASIENIIGYRHDNKIEDEFGSDLGDTLDQMRKRDGREGDRG
ncbi:hypothetical protein HOT31_gp147 [Microbacterium phage Hendrix]|uniref:Uncharacterized protein n=1 Tax=Microbacterium phage Hendrix TaxID=2182341 RepID=A0A2U8UUR6_9CAUD|nr:hypothetical protein HOT31_gp147 [Microbacterium phage Hendrix]AWN07817.1 hypothetical protein PBI_HENDRIX_146 [Microbacterium phage Hendrix]